MEIYIQTTLEGEAYISGDLVEHLMRNTMISALVEHYDGGAIALMSGAI